MEGDPNHWTIHWEPILQAGGKPGWFLPIKRKGSHLQ